MVDANWRGCDVGATHTATGHDTFLVCRLGRVHRVVDAVLALLDLDLAAATDADDSDAARQLFSRAFTPYFATSPRQPPDRAPAPPSSGCHQTCRGLRGRPFSLASISAREAS